MTRGTCRFDDRGQVAGIEAVAFGFLILVAGSLLLANAWAVVDAKFAATAAAREATRIYVEAASEAEALQAGLLAARSSIEAHGLDPDDLALSLDVIDGFGRCRQVTAEVTLHVRSVSLPFIGGFGRLFDVRATHSEIVDPYRSGLSGRADCAN